MKNQDVGAGWKGQKGAIFLRINPGISLNYVDLAGNMTLALWPIHWKTSNDAPNP